MALWPCFATARTSFGVCANERRAVRNRKTAARSIYFRLCRETRRGFGKVGQDAILQADCQSASAINDYRPGRFNRSAADYQSAPLPDKVRCHAVRYQTGFMAHIEQQLGGFRDVVTGVD